MSARFDVLPEGMSGSFDANWRKVVWDEHDACGDGCEHEHAGVEAEAGHEEARGNGESGWSRGLGWAVVIAWCGLIGGFGIERICRTIRC